MFYDTLGFCLHVAERNALQPSRSSLMGRFFAHQHLLPSPLAPQPHCLTSMVSQILSVWGTNSQLMVGIS